VGCDIASWVVHDSYTRLRFLARPIWLLSHLFVVLLVVAMVNLGFWQLRRLDFKRDRNALIESRMDQPVVAVDDLLGPDADEAAIDGARYRRVSATGTYDDDATVVVRNRSQDGAPGGWLVTPMTVAPGTGERVGIVRGFVRLDDQGDPVRVPAPEGDVTVQGAVVDPGRFDGTAPRDIEALFEVPDTLPGVMLADKGSEPDDLMVAVPLPPLSEGPHLSYAVQWFIFSTIAVVGYPLILARVVRRRGKEVDDDDG
jgi:surfeit locus 1 family protein